ncbi:uncharacterized protein [Diabrotica undecimpunctata]|uniref:uncharacterized protein n=1 Tax=Diabrotica undecimpunctata TaxID=50387 RepID=UPI003B63ED03
MKLNLIIIFVVICICGVQSNHPAKPFELTDENAAALMKALRELLEAHKNPEHVRKTVVEKAHTIKSAIAVTTKTRSRIPDLQTLLKTFYYGLGSVVNLLLPPNKDVFDVVADVAEKLVSYFVHDNQPLLDLLNKIILAASSLARIAINSALDIIIGPLNNQHLI